MRVAVALLIAVASASCGGESAVPVPDRELVATRTVTYGTAEGEGALSGVFDIDVDTEGRVYVSEPSFARVVVFKPDGSFHSIIGSRGQGPGEFQFPGNLTWLGDTLAVLEFQRGISLFERDGSYAGQISFALRGQSRRFPLGPMAPLSDGTVVSFAPTVGEDVLAGRLDRELWLKMSREGSSLDTLAFRRLEGDYYAVERDGRPRTGSHPLATGDVLALPPDGSSLVLATRELPPSAEAAVFTLIRLDLAGDTVQHVEVPFELIEVRATDREALASAMTSLDRSDEGFADRVREIESAVEWPQHFPAFETVLSGRDGSVWVKRHLQRDGAARWDVFDADFQRLGHVYLPDSLDVRLVSLRSVYGLELDEYDVPRIVRFDVGG